MKLKFKTILIAGLILGLAFVAWLVWSAANRQIPVIVNLASENLGSATGDYFSTSDRFGFRQPAETEVIELEERGGRMFLVRQAGGAVVQIFVIPFDEPAAALTPARLARDLPELKIETSAPLALGEAEGLTFVSVDSVTARRREAWFVFADRLYQVSAYLRDEDLLWEILQAWRFE